MIRIGQSTDIHQLVKGRKLILGGVEMRWDCLGIPMRMRCCMQ